MPSAAITVEERQAAIRALNGAVAPTVTNAIFEGLNMTIFGGVVGSWSEASRGKDNPAIRGFSSDTWTRVQLGGGSRSVFVSGFVCQGLDEIDPQWI